MRCSFFTFALLFCALLGLSACALGKKEWPAPQSSQDRFSLELVVGERQNECLHLEIVVSGAVDRLYRASIQYETVGPADGEGCAGCPFVPREAIHFTRGQPSFALSGDSLKLDLCSLAPDKQYRFRVAGKSELPASPLVYTDVFITTP